MPLLGLQIFWKDCLLQLQLAIRMRFLRSALTKWSIESEEFYLKWSPMINSHRKSLRNRFQLLPQRGAAMWACRNSSIWCFQSLFRSKAALILSNTLKLLSLLTKISLRLGIIQLSPLISPPTKYRPQKIIFKRCWRVSTCLSGRLPTRILCHQRASPSCQRHAKSKKSIRSTSSPLS